MPLRWVQRPFRMYTRHCLHYGVREAPLFRVRTALHKCIWWREWLDVLQPVPAGLATLALCCGVVMAILMNGQNGPTDSKRVKPGQSLYAGCFDPLPEGSVGERYVALLRQRGE